MIDTVKIQSPPLRETTFRHLQGQLDFITKTSPQKDHEGNHINKTEYEISTGNIPGSFDHCINAKLNYETKSITFTGSVHKALMGHNVFAGPEWLVPACIWLIKDMEEKLQCDLPDPVDWRLCEVHIAEIFHFEDPKVIPTFISIYAKTNYARRKPDVRGNQSVTWRGVNTTIKFYHKGPEFKVHDGKRLSSQFALIDRMPVAEVMTADEKEEFMQEVFEFAKELYMVQNGSDTVPPDELEKAKNALPQLIENLTFGETRPVEILQNLANHILRIEVELKSKQLRDWYGAKATLRDIDQPQIEAEFWRQVQKITLEGQSEMDTVMNALEVESRLTELYGYKMGTLLFGTYSKLSVIDEKILAQKYDRKTLYRHKKKIREAGIDWRTSTITEGQVLIPADFSLSKESPYRLSGQSPEVEEALRPYLVA